MSIHILIEYVANALRYINTMGFTRINLNLNYSANNQKIIVSDLVIDCLGSDLPDDFHPAKYLPSCYLPYYKINHSENRISIVPRKTVYFANIEQEVIHSIKLRLLDISTPIFINDIQLNSDLKDINWTFQDENAYYLLNSVFDQSSQPLLDKSQHYIKQLDLHLSNLVICNGVNRSDILDIRLYGVSGIVVPKFPLPVNKDNLIDKQASPRWQHIHSKLCSTLLKRINSWQRGTVHPVLSRINRTILFNELTPLQLTPYQLLALMDAPLFITANGKKLNMLNLLKPYRVHFHLDKNKWSKRKKSDISYLINCAEFFGNLSSNKNRHFVHLLNSPQHQVAIFLELIEKYFNTISGYYNYKTVFSKDTQKYLEQQRSVFQRYMQLSSRVVWVFHFNNTEVIYEFGFNGLSKAKSVDIAI